MLPRSRSAAALSLIATAAFAFGAGPLRGHVHVERGHEYEHDHVHGGWHEHDDHDHPPGRDEERPRSIYLPAVSADAPAAELPSVPGRIEPPILAPPADRSGLVQADRPHDPSIPRAPPA